MNKKAQKEPTPGRTGNVLTSRNFFRISSGFFQRPQQILFLWNWKAGWLSVILRGPIFLVAAVKRGLGAAVLAVLTECVFCIITAGFYGAVVQSLREAEPEWLTVVFLLIVMPGIFQFVEYLLHHFSGTPHLRIAEIVSVFLSGFSCLFNWYAMRRGALLVGDEGATLGTDLRRLPGLIVRFLTTFPRWLKARMSRSTSSAKCSPRLNRMVPEPGGDRN